MNNFVREVLGVDKPRKHKLKDSYGMNDFYKYIKDKPEFKGMTQALITNIIRALNEALAERYAKGSDIELPSRLGRLEVRIRKGSVEIKDGLVVDDFPVDWKRTLELWEEDAYSRLNKVLVKKLSKDIYRMFYNINTAIYTNKHFFRFYPSRQLKLKVKKNVENREINAFLIRKE